MFGQTLNVSFESKAMIRFFLNGVKFLLVAKSDLKKTATEKSLLVIF